MSTYGPLLLSPRLDPKLWGGRRLERFGFSLPAGDAIGEAVITAEEAAIASGAAQGRTLGELIAEDPLTALGERGLAATGGRATFPMLIKLIDANDVLSIQVHPNNENAPAGSLGKTEAWYVLDAEPGSLLYLGFREGVKIDEIERLARTGQSISAYMHSAPAVPGETIFLPAGSVHALGAGVLIYEIQQPSAITYRLDDWGRVDANGNPRDLHLDESFAVLDPAWTPATVRPVELDAKPRRRTRLVSSRFFTLERIELRDGDSLGLDGAGAPQAVTCISGTCLVRASAFDQKLLLGQTAAVLANEPTVTLSSDSACVVLRGWLDPST